MEAPENGKELPHSAHASGMNELHVHTTVYVINYIHLTKEIT